MKMFSCFLFTLLFLCTSCGMGASLISEGASGEGGRDYLILGILVLLVTIALLFFRNYSLKRLLDQKTVHLIKTEEQLEKHQKLFDDVLDAIPDMVWLKDGEGTYLMCNRELVKLAGSTKEEIIGGTDYDIFPKDKSDSYREHDLQAIKNRKTTINEESADYNHAGYSIWIETSKTPLYGKKGELVGVLGIGRNIRLRRETLRESRENQEFLDIVVDRSPIPMWIGSPNGTALRANQAFYNGLNLKPQHIVGKYNIFEDDNFKRPDIASKIDLVFHKKQPVRFDLLWKLDLVKKVDVSGGRDLYIDVSMFPLLNNNGDMTHIVVQGVDITARIEMEERLRQSEERYRGVAEDMPVLICRFLPGGEITYVNEAYCDYFSRTAETLVGSSFLSLIPKEDHDHVMRSIYVLTAESPTSSQEHKVFGKDGEIRWQRWTNRALFDSNKNIVAFQSIGEDITERKESDADRERLMLAIGQAAETILITDTEGIIEYANPAFEQATGYTSEETIGESLLFLNSDSGDDDYSQDMWDKLKKGEVWSGRLVNKNKRGEIFTEEAIISPVLDEEGVIVNYVAAKRDITKELVLESQLRQSQKMEAIGRLAGGVAHDFNNMLGVILGYVDIILEQIEPGHQFFKALTEINKAGIRSADLTKQLLAFARKQTVTPKIIDLNETVEGMTMMLLRLIGEDIQLAWLPGDDLWPVKIDPSQIDQILANLCVNSRDAIADIGKVTIETSNTKLDDAYCENNAGFVPGDYVLLAVSDNGCGMDSATVAKVFEPFFTTKESSKGTGLGLATVYGAVKQNNGFVNVYSEPGQGTTFRVYLPRDISGDPLPEKEPDLPMGGGDETILLVEDEPAILNLAKIMLKNKGYTVVTASTPGEAIKTAGDYSGDIHLLMTDVVMPEMNGRDLAKEVRNFYPNLKLLFMSGYTANVIAHHGVLDEGVNFIQKPFSKVDLAVMLRRALES